MTHNQEQLQNNIQAITGTDLTYNEDWSALFDDNSIFEGAFNDRMVAYLQSVLDSSLDNLNELKALYAIRQGLDRWEQVTEIVPPMLSNNVFWGAADGNLSTTGSLVDTLEDMSGSGNDATSSGAARSTLTSNQVNGLPSLIFGGAQSLDLPSDLYSIPNGPHTSFSVSIRDASGSVETVWGMSALTNNATFLIYNAASGTISFKNRVGATGAVISSGNTEPAYNIFTARRDGTEQGISVDGETEITNANGGNVTGIDAAKIGAAGTGAFALTGGIAEFILYDRSLSAAEISLVNNYLSKKYNIALA